MAIVSKHRLTQRQLVRLVSYALAAVVALSGGIIAATYRAVQYRTQLEYTYERGLSELSEHISQIELALSKGLYTGTSAGATNLAMDLWNSAGSAKTCLSQIPTYGTDLEGTYKFFSQVGEFSLSLAKKLQAGQSVTKEEYAQLKTLSSHAKALTQTIDSLCYEMNENGKWKKQIRAVVEEQSTQQATNTLYNGLNDLEEIFTDYPTLLYDGPFSEHLLQAKPLYISGLPIVKESVARKTAAEALGVSQESFDSASQSEHTAVPCYVYNTNNATVSITKQGGVVNYLNRFREIGNNTLTYDQCIEQAKAYLISLDLGEFVQRYYSVSEGVCLINFAYQQDNVVCYTDLIKIGVALDNGQIVSYNAQGFIMNHQVRQLKKPAHTMEEAQQVLSPLLTVKKKGKAIIPSNAREPLVCYEFLCETDQKQEILVYVNAQTLAEEELLFLLKTDGGTLTI
ncbi:MAG: germination protein YpeB [Clostridia bacterium]|nr:germination protein YpeB [Clostridia bacterium]